MNKPLHPFILDCIQELSKDGIIDLEYEQMAVRDLRTFLEQNPRAQLIKATSVRLLPSLLAGSKKYWLPTFRLDQGLLCEDCGEKIVIYYYDFSSTRMEPFCPPCRDLVDLDTYLKIQVVEVQ